VKQLKNLILFISCVLTLASCSRANLPLFVPNGGDNAPASSIEQRFDVSNSYKVIHSFSGPDGSAPGAALIALSGILYGTTTFGGAYSCGGFTCGTLFSMTTGGTEKVLHSFGKGSDGANPRADLIDVGDTLYGTTYSGAFGYGTVFSITTGGAEKVLHSFGNGTDGRNPTAGLIDAKGTLYGTTEFGGKHNRGTFFSITTGGAEKVLHSFGKGTDGSEPLAQLIYKHGSLVGTTNVGGAYGYGTVFSITPAVPKYRDWKYPAGGNYTKAFRSFGADQKVLNLQGVTLSVAPSQ
jgi:uncharacterized repeat protein (TIGR03803 family)